MCAVTAVDSAKRALELLGSVCGLTEPQIISRFRNFRFLCCIACAITYSCIGLQGANVSMIITDYWMPDMTGYELLKKVKVI